MRTTIAHRHTEPLRVADHDVCIPLARRHQQRQGQQVSGNAKRRTVCMGLAGQRPQVMDAACRGRVLRQHTEVIAFSHQVRQGGSGRADLDLDAKWPGAGLQHFNGLRMAVARDNKYIAFTFHAAFGQRHCFRRSGGFIEHGGVGNRHAGQIADHGLKVDQRLQAAL